MSASSVSSRTVLCKNLDQRVTPAMLHELFLQAGPLVNVSRPIRRDKDEEPRRKNEEKTTEEKRETPMARTTVEEEEREGKTGMLDDELKIDNRSDSNSNVTLGNDCKESRKNVQSVSCVEEIPIQGQTATSGVRIEKQTDSFVNRKSSKDLKESDRNENHAKDPDYQPFAFVIYCYRDAAEYAVNLFKSTKLFGRSLILKVCGDDVATRVDGNNVRKRAVAAGPVDGYSSGRRGGATQTRLHVDRVQPRYRNNPAGHYSCECLDENNVKTMQRDGYSTYNSSRNNRFEEVVSSHYEKKQAGIQISSNEKVAKDKISRNLRTLNRNAKIADRLNGSCKQTDDFVKNEDCLKNGNAYSFSDSARKTTDPCTESCKVDTLTQSEQRGNGNHEQQAPRRSRKTRNYNHEQHYQADHEKGEGLIQNGTANPHTSTKSQGRANTSRTRKISRHGPEQGERRMTSVLSKSPEWCAANDGVNDRNHKMESSLRSSTDQRAFRDRRQRTGDEHPMTGTSNRSGNKQNVSAHYKDEQRRSRNDVVNSNMEYINSSYQPYQSENMSYALPPTSQRKCAQYGPRVEPHDVQNVHGARSQHHKEPRKSAALYPQNSLWRAGQIPTRAW